MKATKKVDWRKLCAHFVLLTLAALTLSSSALGAQGGQALPWEAPLTKLQQSLSGPVAGAIAVISFGAVWGGLVFCGAGDECAPRSLFAGFALSVIAFPAPPSFW